MKNTTEVSDKRICVYSKNDCIYCIKAKNLLETEDLMGFASIHMVDDIDERQALKEKFNVTTFPIILLDGKLIGGYSEFHTYLITNIMDF
jgi:glutaredoxin 3